MERFSMSATLSRGAAAALLVLGSAAVAHAQTGGGVVRARGDSIFIRQIGPGGVRIDSVMVLFRALQQEPFGSTDWVFLRSKIDSLLPSMARARVSSSEALPHGWIGINVGGVPRHEMITESGDVIRYLAYPAVISVDPESPASRAGIAPGDVLVAYNGMDVVEHDVNLTQLFIPEKRMSVTVRRDGETKDFAVQIARMPEHVMQRRLAFDGVVAMRGRGEMSGERGERGNPEVPSVARITVMPPMPGGIGAMGMGSSARMYIFAPDGIFGARVSPVSPVLAKALKLETGVLVNDVADESLAARSGLLAGDVIISAGGQPVTTMSELQRAIAPHLTERAVELQVVRDKKTRKINVKW
jgi:membrane-associated protease RseP (regulator of RpoE activity)